MKFEIEDVDSEEIERLLDEYEPEYEPDMIAEEYPIEEENKEKIVIDDNTEFLLSVTILKDKEYNIVDSISITEETLISILQKIGYGNIGWEKYNLVKEQNILD